MTYLRQMVVNQEYIHRLSLSENTEDRLEAARLLQDDFSSLPYKSAAWSDVIRLTADVDSSVKTCATLSFGLSFFYDS